MLLRPGLLLDRLVSGLVVVVVGLRLGRRRSGGCHHRLGRQEFLAVFRIGTGYGALQAGQSLQQWNGQTVESPLRCRSAAARVGSQELFHRMFSADRMDSTNYL